MQFHILAMATFASLIAPFGGFFASGLKRTFKIKDFGDLVPGHGGITGIYIYLFRVEIFVEVYSDDLPIRPNGLPVYHGFLFIHVLSVLHRCQSTRHRWQHP